MFLQACQKLINKSYKYLIDTSNILSGTHDRRLSGEHQLLKHSRPENTLIGRGFLKDEVCVCVGTAVHSRPGLGEAHGQQHVQSRPMFDGTWPVLPLPPRSHFGIQFLLRCHASMLHPSLAASLMYSHVLEISKIKIKKSNGSGKLFIQGDSG